MSNFIVEHTIFRNSVAKVILAESGISIQTASGSVDVAKESVKNIEIFRSTKKFCMRILTEGECYDCINVDESYVAGIKQKASAFYGITIANTNLEILNTTEGNLMYSNNILTLHSSKPVFSIPKNQIDKIVEIDSELQVHLDGVELVMSTTSNISEYLNNKVAEETCVLTQLNCVYPRSKNNVIFYDTYFESRGSSYDHTIFYKNITELMYLTTEGETYLVVKLDNPILQGQTRYDSMVFSLDKKDIEVSAKDKRLKDYYTGTQDEVVVEIFEKMLGVEARQAMFFVKCNNKVNNGVLFFMESGLQFLTKNMYVEKRNIVLVEFQRLNVPAIQARTFDMSVHADKVYTFSSISKDVFPSIEDYFGKDGIKMVSEVMEEYSEPSNEESEDDSNLSDIIADTDEDD